MKWYLPSWNGDHRLETVKEGESCRLTVVNPTPDERLMLERFLKKLKRKKIIEATEVPETELLIPAPIGKVAPLLVKEARPKRTTITAVRYEGGRLEIVEGTDRSVVELGERIDAAETKKEEAVTAVDVQQVDAQKVEEKPKVAASVKRPTMCCPQCIPGSVAPASEVLLEFLTPEQHESWAKQRVVEVHGHLSGHRYLVSHRHAPLAQRWGRVCFDVDDQNVLHFHDWEVPPEEEVLATVLLLGSREPWLRNEASCFYGNFKSVFKNPFGGVGDGIKDAQLTQQIGVLGKALGEIYGIN